MTEPSVDPAVPACQDPEILFVDPIPGVIPFGSLTVVAGASGAGKTILWADWAARMRDGRTICGHPTQKPTDFYIIAADRDWSTYARAYNAAGFPDIKRYVLAEDPDFDPRSWGRKSSAFTLFEDCLKRLNPLPGSIVFVDPVAPLFIQGNQNDSRDVALSLHWYRKLAAQYRITLVLFANVAKQKQEETYRRAQDRIAGSGAFVAYSDTQVSVDQDDNKIVTMRWTPRMRAGEEYQFVFSPETGLFVPHTSSAIVDGQTLPAHLARVYELVPAEGIHLHLLVKLVIKQLNLKKAMAYRNVKALVEQGILKVDEEGKLHRKQTH